MGYGRKGYHGAGARREPRRVTQTPYRANREEAPTCRIHDGRRPTRIHLQTVDDSLVLACVVATLPPPWSRFDSQMEYVLLHWRV